MKIKKELMIIIAVMLLAFALRAYHINAPFTDHHSWKQTEVAEEARNFYEVKYNIFYPLVSAHADDADGNFVFSWNEKPGLHYIEEVFPLVPFLAATLYFIFGEHPWIGRLVVILFSIGTIPYLYWLVKRRISKDAALFSVLFFAVLPLNIFFGRAFQEESAMIFFIVAGLYHIGRWVDTDLYKDLFIGGIFIALSIMVKIPNLYIGLPIAYLMHEKYGWKFLTNKKTWILACAILMPPLLYYGFAHYGPFQQSNISITFGNTDTIKDLIGGNWEKIAFLQPLFYTQNYQHIRYTLFTTFGSIIFLIGLFIIPVKNEDEKKIKETAKKEAHRKDYLFHFWLLSVIISFYIIASQTIPHTYYKMPLVPVGSVFMGIIMDKLKNKTFRIESRPDKSAEDRLNKPIRIGAFVFIIPLILLAASVYNVLPLYSQNMLVYYAAKDLEQVSKKDDLVITVLYGDDPEVLYNADRKGWGIGTGALKIDRIERWRNAGAKYMIDLLPSELNNFPEERDYLLSNYNFINRNNYWLIFDLRQKRDVPLNLTQAVQQAEAQKADTQKQADAQQGN